MYKLSFYYLPEHVIKRSNHITRWIASLIIIIPGVDAMSTYEVLTLLTLFGMFLIALRGLFYQTL